MLKYVTKRLLIAVITILIILFVLFLMLQYMPGSPFNDERLSADQIAALEAKYGLDDPVPVRFFNYVKNMLSGDFGVSYTIQQNLPISTMLGSRFLLSLKLGLEATILGSFIGLILGVFSALRHNTGFDTAATVVSVLGISLPSYVFAIGLSYFLGFKLHLFPMLYTSKLPFASQVLPVLALSMFPIATIARYARSEMLEVLNSEYMLLAECKGITSMRVIIMHGIRNALIPVITVLGPMVVGQMMGSMVIENMFSIPGIGSLLVVAIQVNDYNVVIAISFLYSLMYILIILAVDILYGIVDPRIRIAKGSGRSE